MRTVFVLVTDKEYFGRAKKTLIDLRTRGQWEGDVVMIPIGFRLNKNFRDFYRITEVIFPPIENKEALLNLLSHRPFPDTIDGREINKINQWEKLHVFDPYFSKWERVAYLDAGMRVCGSVHDSILALNCTSAILSPDDSKPSQKFGSQLSSHSSDKLRECAKDIGGDAMFQAKYLMNCLWVYDTAILRIPLKDEMIEGMLKHPICLTNEMAMMNIYVHFKYKLWKPFPRIAPGQTKWLYEWCESNLTGKPTWRDFYFIKYSITLRFEDT
jgi:hypothetical protein